jgi:replicative DNA helicase
MSPDLTLPPYDETVERAVLGATLIGDVFFDVAEILGEEDFYFMKHRLIWRAMMELSRKSEPIDCLTVSDILVTLTHMEQVGGASVVAELTGEVASAANVKHHAKLVRECSVLRILRRVGMSLTDQATARQPAEQIATEAERQIFDAMWSRQTHPWRTSAEVMIDAVVKLDLAKQRGLAVHGIESGLADLDRMTGGWQLGDLTIIAGRTGMGKTGLACGAAVEAARSGKQVAIVSLEMGVSQLAARLIAYEANVSVFDILSGRIYGDHDQRARRAAMTLGALPICYEDSGVLTMDQLRAKARQLRIKKQLDVLFVDYLQLMQSGKKHDSRQVEVSEISRGLKLLAKELEIAVVALSQLSRKCEEREDKRPILSDLRESGSIEQDADVVLCIYRDEVYNKESPDVGTAELLIRKHRNGPIGDVRVTFLNDSAKFANLVELA